MDTVELVFEYTQAEYIKAERQYLFASKTITKTSIVVIALYLPFSIYYLLSSSCSVLSIIALAVALLGLLMGWGIYFWLPAYKFQQTAKYHEEYHVTFSQDRIIFQTPTIDSDLKWDIYSEIWSSDDFYFLIQAPRIYSLMPKRAFASPAVRQAFEEMAISNLKCSIRVL
ncbi:MAG: YcxB family protein [Clostridiales bacterium]|nr:YcxB family protein [Clostridiales bacterium]